MMALKLARDAGGGMLRGQHLHRAQRHIAALDPTRHGTLAQHLQAHALALHGRGGDTEIAHVTPGGTPSILARDRWSLMRKTTSH